MSYMTESGNKILYMSEKISTFSTIIVTNLPLPLRPGRQTSVKLYWTLWKLLLIHKMYFYILIYDFVVYNIVNIIKLIKYFTWNHEIEIEFVLISWFKHLQALRLLVFTDF